MIPEIVRGGPVFGYRNTNQVVLFSVIKYSIASKKSAQVVVDNEFGP